MKSVVDQSVDYAEQYWITKIQGFKESLRKKLEAQWAVQFPEEKASTDLFAGLPKEYEAHTQQINLMFDMENDLVYVTSENLNDQGIPYISYTVDADGNVIDNSIKIAKDSSTFNPYGLTPEELEEQRDIAFKVVFFFVSFIAVCFGLLYVYHRMQQASIDKEEEKQNFFDFLAGQIDEDYPNVMTARYMR